MCLNLDANIECCIFAPPKRFELKMKLSKNPLTHVMLKNLYFSLDQVLDNLKATGRIEGEHGKDFYKSTEYQNMLDITLARPQRSWQNASILAPKQGLMESLVSHYLGKIFVWMRWLGIGKFSPDERTIEKLGEFRDVLGKSLDAYASPMQAFIVDSDKTPQVLALMHYFLDTKKGKQAVLFIEGFIESLFITKPTLAALLEEFPNIGSKTSINNFLEDRQAISQEEIVRVAEIICQHKLAQEIIHS